MSKAEATRLADALDSITFVSGKSQTLDEAADLLRQWPDGEPVAVVEADGVLRFKKTGRKWQVGDKLYTAPPDSAARIAELEAEVGDLKVGSDGMGGEGWNPEIGWRHYLNSEDGEPAYTAIESYRSLWESINGPGSWEANPLVWAITFRRITP